MNIRKPSADDTSSTANKVDDVVVLFGQTILPKPFIVV